VDNPVKHPYGGGGGGHKGTNAAPFYERITDAQMQKICDCIVSGVPKLAAFKKYVAVSKSTLDRAIRVGAAALKKWERDEGVDPKTGLLSDPSEAAAMRFVVLLDRATAGKVEALMHRSLCNVVTYKDSEGTERLADPAGAKQAMVMLARQSYYQQDDEIEEDEEGPNDAQPTREELIADLRTLMQTDPDLFEAVGLVKK